MHHYEQECIPVGCVACYSSTGVSVQRGLWTENPLLDRDPLDRNPTLDSDPILDRIPPDRDLLDRDLPWTETSPVNRITDRCKNINLP